MFVSDFLRNEKHLTDYISITQFIQKFINKNNIEKEDLQSFVYNINKYFYTNFYLFMHKKTKALYLDAVSKAKEFHKHINEPEFISSDNLLAHRILQDFHQNTVIKYKKHISGAIIAFLNLHVNPEKIDKLTQEAINEILDILEYSDYYMILNHRDKINNLIKTITTDLAEYLTEKDRTKKKVNNIIKTFKTTDSLLNLNNEELSNVFLKEYLSLKISENYPKFHSICKLNEISKGYGFELIAEYVWNNPQSITETLDYFYEHLRKKKQKLKIRTIA